jgi:hypothetical protein
MQTGDLPLIARRTAAIKLYPEIPKLEEKLTKMFGKPYTIQYDLAATIANLKKHIEELDWNTKERIPELAPDYTAQYLKAAVEHLESKKFGSDDMLQEAFNEAADKGIVSFELVEKLKVRIFPRCESRMIADTISPISMAATTTLTSKEEFTRLRRRRRNSDRTSGTAALKS